LQSKTTLEEVTSSRDEALTQLRTHRENYKQAIAVREDELRKAQQRLVILRDEAQQRINTVRQTTRKLATTDKQRESTYSEVPVDVHTHSHQ
jgi:chromosome segregation ATPase